jgi:hypothetical protein
MRITTRTGLLRSKNMNVPPTVLVRGVIYLSRHWTAQAIGGMVYKACVVLWSGAYRQSISEMFDSYTQASRWVHQQRLANACTFVQGYIL